MAYHDKRFSDTIAFNLTAEQHEKLRKVAKKRKVLKSELLRQLIETL